MKDTSERDAEKKKPYVKPVVARVNLTSEEVVLGHCKAASSTAGSKSPGFPCIVCGVATGS
ncbi:MAG TPA: hypothetical protein DCP92_10975 [Nitrospiraceae bacterium]|jgi:hypothetical protein|nr:hypothetical protein [Nitrospiraceae bacterium]